MIKKACYWYEDKCCPDGCTQYIDGTIIWCLNGEFHRDDGPSLIYPFGSEYWHRNGKLHRDNGPAVILADGTEFWWVDGQKIDPLSNFDWKVEGL